MRVPCIMRQPGTIPAGQVQRELATAMDVLPTLVKLAGAVLPTGHILDGKDISQLMTVKPGAKTPHDAFYYCRDERLQAVRSGPWNLDVYRPNWNEESSSRKPMLFNLKENVGERNDVTASHPGVVERLQLLAEKARADLGDAATGRKGANLRPVGRL